MSTHIISRKNLLLLSLFVITMLFYSCHKDDGTNIPEEETIDQEELLGNPDELVADIQRDFLELIEGYNSLDMQVTRLDYHFRAYEDGYIDNSKLETSWLKAYDILEKTALLEELNDQDLYNVPNHTGLAEVLQAYAFMILVDHLGDVPFSEALDPTTFPNPNLDNGADVYTIQLAILNRAIVHLTETGDSLPEDYFYESGFDSDRWVALANTLKLRAFLNMRLINPNEAAQGISNLLSENIIDDVAEDFQFRYNTTDNQHPWYYIHYSSDRGSFGYVSNWMLDVLNAGDANPPFIEEGIADPRLRYYMYRQSDRLPDEILLPCEYYESGYSYCHVGNSYWGRDHGGSFGIPPDTFVRTTPSVYPAGGAFDRDLFETVVEVDQVLHGAGIFPIFLSSFTQFQLAEAALTLNLSTGDAGTYLESGIRMSMDKVASFGQGLDLAGFEMTTVQVDEYIARILNEYNSASQEAKLNIIEREFFLAAWGNGLETYNAYKRTGHPDVQSPQVDAGNFPRVYIYPESVVATNPNIIQQPVTTQTFWDINPPGFID
ncbi:MAG: SusD/RagB family nutrient-binding outer membrane lipoprotein [Bacteroidetes bacterium]|nr:SusD/RagB family nutrient-binding outer membrane lipoprotein [Bacteroidota bacterium]